MTTGTTTYDQRVPTTVVAPDGTSRVTSIGSYWSKTWGGSDAKQSKKTVTFPSYSFPPRPDLENRLPNEDSKSFRRRKRRLLNEWLSLVDEYHRSKPRKKPQVYRRRVVMPPCSYTMSKSKMILAPMHIKDPNGRWYTQAPAIIMPGHIPLDPKDHYAVLEKLRRKAYGSGFHPGITTAEGIKTLKMFATSASQIRLAMVALWNGSLRGIFRQLGNPTPQWAGRARDGFLGFHEGRKTFSQAWLCFAYGWRPLLKDMEDGGAWLAELLYGADHQLVNRISARKSFVKQSWGLDNDLRTYRYAFMQRVSIHRVQYVITNLKISPAVSQPSLVSLAGVAWEVLPYSFVCDWVAPISSYLQALRTSKDLQGTVVLSILSHTYWEFPQVHKTMKGAIPVTAIHTPRQEIINFSRTVQSEINPPTPLGDLSPSSVFSHWTRAVSALALLQNLRFPEGDRTGFNKLLGRRS